MQNHCPTCGAPITDHARFCAHCGAKLPDADAARTIEIKYEDAAKLEEVRLKYEAEERQRLEKQEAGKRGARALKIKRWAGWLLCVLFLCLGMAVREDRTLSAIFVLLFVAAGVYAFVITILSVFRRR